MSGGTASCQGVCAPSQVECSSTTAQQTCSATGTWATPVTCTNQTCVGSGVGTSCQGVCAPGQLQCTAGGQPQNCSASGQWQNNGANCGGQACVNGACTGADCSSFTPAVCNGTTTCDVRSNTCCVTLSTLAANCVPGANASCTSGQAPSHCRYSCDCPNGQSCCGEIDTSPLGGATVCQTLANGASCVAPGPNWAAAQLCEQDIECKNGQKCIAQTCVLNAKFNLCGLQNQPPYNCTADKTDGGP